MVNESALREIESLTERYRKNWGTEPDFTAVPRYLTQEKMCLVLRRIVETGESVLVGSGKVREMIGKYYSGIDWSDDLKNGEVLPEPCPFCGGKVRVERFGTYGQSSVVYCEAENCMRVECRGL